MAILTMIDDQIYDIGNIEFVDAKRDKIIHYDNLTNYYDETNARLRFFTKEEPRLKQKTVLVDVDDESMISLYEKTHVEREESEDLTGKFISEFKDKPYTLKK